MFSKYLDIIFEELHSVAVFYANVNGSFQTQDKNNDIICKRLRISKKINFFQFKVINTPCYNVIEDKKLIEFENKYQ